MVSWTSLKTIHSFILPILIPWTKVGPVHLKYNMPGAINANFNMPIESACSHLLFSISVAVEIIRSSLTPNIMHIFLLCQVAIDSIELLYPYNLCWILFWRLLLIFFGRIACLILRRPLLSFTTPKSWILLFLQRTLVSLISLRPLH